MISFAVNSTGIFRSMSVINDPALSFDEAGGFLWRSAVPYLSFVTSFHFSVLPIPAAASAREAVARRWACHAG
jgi:hypothetical protein